MRNPIENVSLLQKRLNDLQLENQVLKNILGSFWHFLWSGVETSAYSRGDKRF